MSSIINSTAAASHATIYTGIPIKKNGKKAGDQIIKTIKGENNVRFT